jgi:hypothetical protein
MKEPPFLGLISSKSNPRGPGENKNKGNGENVKKGR